MSNFDQVREENANLLSQVYKLNQRAEMIAELRNQQNESKATFGVNRYWQTLSDFCKWHIDNRATKDLREDLRSDMEEIIFSEEIVDSVIYSMNEEEIRDSSLKAYKREVGKKSLEGQVDEMISWGYELPKKEEDPWHLYLLVKLTVDAGSDYEDVVNECDYRFTHDNILGSEILDYRTEQDGDSPVLYIP